MPPELQKRPDLTLGRDRGRIWRIVPEKHVTKAVRPNLAKATTAELVKTLAHPEPWWRTTAQRLLLERNDKAMIEPLSKLLATTPSPHAKIVAAWMLERQDALEAKELKRLLKDAHPRVREHALRLLEPRWNKKSGFTVLDVNLADPDARTRFALALSLGGVESFIGGIGDILSDIAFRGRDDRWTRLAVQAALPGHTEYVLEQMLAARQLNAAMARELSTVVAAQKTSSDTLRTILDGLLRQSAEVKWAGLVGLAEGLERRGLSLAPKAGDPEEVRKQVAAIFTDAAGQARDAKQPVEQRLLCTRLLGQAPWPTAKQALVPLVTEETAVELRIAALRSLAMQQDKEVPALLVKLWPAASPPVRREILEAMLRRPERIALLLDEIEARRVKASEIDAARIRQLTSNADAKIRERAKKLLQDNLPADRQAVLKQYQSALALKGDARRGQEVFKKNCATCHKVAGIGIDVGPDIADTRTKTPAALLTDIVLPNQAIDNNYVNYLVTTKDGRVLTGILAAESATSVTLKRAEGQTDVVLRQDIEEIASTGVSLMPEGLEKDINVQQMADLIRFLKDWRYLDGSVPVAP
jgi:putative heme-binding domain-containing protein